MPVMRGSIAYPNFDVIVDICKNVIESRFSDYGNDWLTTDDQFWHGRLTNEVSEYMNASTKTEARRKLLNIINIAAMAFDNKVQKEKDKCPTCGSTMKIKGDKK